MNALAIKQTFRQPKITDRTSVLIVVICIAATEAAGTVMNESNQIKSNQIKITDSRQLRTASSSEHPTRQDNRSRNCLNRKFWIAAENGGSLSVTQITT